jgi:hypothetical protein
VFHLLSGKISLEWSQITPRSSTSGTLEQDTSGGFHTPAIVEMTVRKIHPEEIHVN